MPNGISNFYQLDWCISVLMVAGWYFIFVKIFIEYSVKQTVESGQTPQYALFAYVP